MQDTDIPYKFGVPWASSAATGYATDPIPANANNATGAAGADLGFPPITSMNPLAGGIPPEIADFNGLGLYTTSWNRWQQAGAPVFYDSVFSAAIGGYPNGARLQVVATPGGIWRSTVDNNTSDPDTGGANWVNDFASSLATSGWQQLPSGLIVQWQQATATYQNANSFALPRAFPNAFLGAIAVVLYSAGSPVNLTAPLPTLAAGVGSLSQVVVGVATGTSSGTVPIQILSWGY